jgi:protein tyrosine phosphatase (PTP) superfamily phosphohydrolase (DUF442 family)
LLFRRGAAESSMSFPWRLHVASLLADHAFLRVGWRNFATVLPGRLYRSNHPSPAALARLVRRAGIRSVINLRGEKYNASNELEIRAARRLGLELRFLGLESRGAPHRERILRLAELYASLPPPILIHCKSGADRAGLAAGIAVLIAGGTSRAALAQMAWKFLHIRASRTGILDAFFELYARTGEGRKPFLDWVREDYHEDQLRLELSKTASFVNDCLLRRE